jgi:hypothetical protein
MNSLDDPDTRRKWLRRLQANAKSGARKREILFKLDCPDFAATLYDRQHGCCAVSGIAFNLERYDDALVKHPFAPSIDRRLSSRGYTEDNVRLVCVAVNFGMGQWGEEVFLTLARAAAALDKGKMRRVTADDWEARQVERIAAAKEMLGKLPENERQIQQHRIAGLTAALTKGRKRLSEIAQKAACARRKGQRPALSNAEWCARQRDYIAAEEAALSGLSDETERRKLRNKIAGLRSALTKRLRKMGQPATTN